MSQTVAYWVFALRRGMMGWGWGTGINTPNAFDHIWSILKQFWYGTGISFYSFTVSLIRWSDFQEHCLEFYLEAWKQFKHLICHHKSNSTISISKNFNKIRLTLLTLENLLGKKKLYSCGMLDLFKIKKFCKSGYYLIFFTD